MGFSFEEAEFIARLKHKNYDPDDNIDDHWYEGQAYEYELYEEYEPEAKLEAIAKEWDVVADRAMLAWRKRGLRAA